MSPMTRVDLGEVIDRQRIGGELLRILAVALAAQILEGFDLVNLAFVAPSLVGEWHIERSAFGPVYSASLVGLRKIVSLHTQIKNCLDRCDAQSMSELGQTCSLNAIDASAIPSRLAVNADMPDRQPRAYRRHRVPLRQTQLVSSFQTSGDVARRVVKESQLSRIT